MNAPALPARPPGTILMHMYFAERLTRLKPGRFVEIGCGNGQLSRILLQCGWTGVGFDLNPAAVAEAAALNRAAIDAGRYQVRQADWFDEPLDRAFDLVLSCLVLEHLDDEAERAFYRKADAVLAADGRMIHFVPGSPAHWGIEDEIAGHMRRYTRAELAVRLERTGWQARHLAGLTYPLSNILYPVSEFLVRRHEGHLAALSAQERTVRSGHRDVPLKTRFSPAFKLALNEWTMWPLHVAQKAFAGADAAMILYVEAVRSPDTAEISSRS